MILPTKDLEKKLFKSGYDRVIGVDEVGVGCLAGPVVACAISFSPEFYNTYNQTTKKFQGLRESKLLSPQQREKFMTELLGQKYKIGLCYPKKIDTINIYHATHEAMRSAIKNISLKKTRTIVLVDGNKKIKNLKFDQQAIVKGDQKVFAIACASVIAKVYRDRMMVQYAKRFPGYAFEQHKGYSTKAHQDALNRLGPCLIHRRSFRLKY